MSKWFAVDVVKTTTYVVELEDGKSDNDASDAVTQTLLDEEWDDVYAHKVEEHELRNLLNITDKDNVFRIEEK